MQSRLLVEGTDPCFVGMKNEKNIRAESRTRTSSVVDWRDNQLHHPNTAGGRRANWPTDLTLEAHNS